MLAAGSSTTALLLVKPLHPLASLLSQKKNVNSSIAGCAKLYEAGQRGGNFKCKAVQ